MVAPDFTFILGCYGAISGGDYSDASPLDVESAEKRFFHRLKLLFEKGLVLSDAGECTFTQQVLTFLQRTKILHFRKSAFVIGLGGHNLAEQIKEPLDRIRLVVQALCELRVAQRPLWSWPRKFAEAYQLPSPSSKREGVKQAFMDILIKAQVQDREKYWKEFRALLPVAEHHRKAGLAIRDAWAHAAADYPELPLGRLAVSFLLTYSSSDTDTERILKQVAGQDASERARLLGSTLDALVLALQAPSRDKIAETKKDVFGNLSLVPTNQYLPRILKAYTEKFGMKAKCKKRPKPRRDTGISKPQHQDPNSEAEPWPECIHLKVSLCNNIL